MSSRQLATETTPPGLLIRLIPSEPVFLHPDPVGDACRFADLFARTWEELPPGIRESILGHWRAHPHWGHPLTPSPAIRLLPDWPSRSLMEDRGTVGVCAAGGHELRFWAPAVDAMRDEVAAALIAHELAHVLLRTSRRLAYHDEEDRVRRLAWRWGFDEDRLDDWLNAHTAELRQLDRACYAAPTLARERRRLNEEE